jgi:2-keto-myo-inositol isomerase
LKIDPSRVCLNRKTAPGLDLEAFFHAARELGVSQVELRNDLGAGLITDGLPAGEFNALAAKYGMKVLTINTLYPFNLLERRGEVARRAEEYLALAAEIDCPAIIMCPLNEPDSRTAERNRRETLDSLKFFGELFAKHGRQGLIEPLGFPGSSLRHSLEAQELLREAKSDFKLVIDTFHHHLSGVETSAFNRGIDIGRIGLVHLSGVEDQRPADQLTDEERLMLSERDVLKTASQVENLESIGYRGVYSFEPFSTKLNQWDESRVKQEVKSSLDLL